MRPGVPLFSMVGKRLRRLAAACWGWRYDALLFVGAGVLATGAGRIYAPAAWIIGGAFLMGYAWVAAQGSVRR